MMETHSWIDISGVWISVVATLVASGSVLLAYWSLRKLEDPDIVVFADLDPRRPTIIVLRIRNIGQGSARNITFTSSRPIPAEAFGLDNIEPYKEMTEGPLIVGIPFMAPGQEFVLNWGQYGGLSTHLGTEPLEVTATCERTNVILPSLRRLKTQSLLDIMSFQTVDTSDRNWDRKSAEQLEKIAASLKTLASKSK